MLHCLFKEKYKILNQGKQEKKIWNLLNWEQVPHPLLSPHPASFPPTILIDHLAC